MTSWKKLPRQVMIIASLYGDMTWIIIIVMLLHVHAHAHVHVVAWCNTLESEGVSTGCPVVFHLGVVDQTHRDNHGQELVPWTRVWREGCCVYVLLSMGVSLLKNVIQHRISDWRLEKNQVMNCQSCQQKGPLAVGNLGLEMHLHQAHYYRCLHPQSGIFIQVYVAIKFDITRH